MGDMSTITRMPGRMQGMSADTVASTSRSKNDDEVYYMDRMREILTGFPNTGPPTYPVQILDHLYMGNQRNADNVELLGRYGITHVLNCAGQRRFDFSRSPYPKDSGIKGFLMISAEDNEEFDIASYFDEAIAFLDRVKKAKGKAFVHCNLGVNRSGAVVAAYLMAEQRKTLLEVINYLKVKRFVVLSNKGFRRQLIQFARSRCLLDPVIRCTDEPAQSRCHHRNNYQDSEKERELRGGRGGGDRGLTGVAKRCKESEMKESRGRGGAHKETKEVKEERGVTGQRGGDYCGERRAASSSTSELKRETKDIISYKTIHDNVDSVQRQNESKLDDPRSGDPGGDTRKGPSSSFPEDFSRRDRLWTLPRYMSRAANGRSPSERSAAVEVIVSEHRESGSGPEGSKSMPNDTSDAKSRAKTPVRQLEPVYESRSCNPTTGIGSATGGSSGRLTAAESMSAKFSGFLNLLGPKKPLRSTSYSNVSSTQSPTSSFSSLSPSSPSDECPTTSSSSLQTSTSGSSLSTARPLRIYTRSSTDSEIYRAKQSASTAGQFGLPRPASKP